MGRKEKEQCIEALLDNWIVCFYFYYDVSKQFELLDKARSIGNEIGYEPSSLWLNYGVMYQTIYEQTRHREYANKAIDAYRKAYTLSLNDKKYGGNNIDIIVTNIIMVSALANNLNSINDIINLYLKTDIKGQEPFVKPYNVETFNALKLTREHKLDKAMKHIDNAIGSVPAGQNYYRYRHVALFNKVKVLMAMHKYHEAISLADQLYAMAEQLDMKDAKIEIYETLANCYNSIGNEGMALKYNIKRYQLKDSILNFQHATQVSESKFINRINSLEAMQQETMKSKRRQATAFAVVMCITIMIAIFSITLYRKNKKLKLGNRALYDKNIEMQKADNDNMQRLKALKEKISLLENSATSHGPAPNAANASVKFTPAS